jgi:Beta-propeller repeat
MKNNTYILCLIIAFLGVYTEGSFAQVAINTDGSSAGTNTMLDLNPAIGKAFVPPKMTYDQIKAISPATAGMVVFDTDFKCLRVYTGTEWQNQQATNKELKDPPGDFAILGTASGTVFPRSTTTDGSGNIYVTGYFQSATASFGSFTLANSGDPNSYEVFVVKYNSSGVVQWAVKGGGTSSDYGSGIAVDGSGNVYITGAFFSTTASFGSFTLANSGGSNGSSDVFVVKYNSSGVVQWAVKGGGETSSDYGSGIAVDGSGNVYITGSFQSGTATFVSTNLASVTLLNSVTNSSSADVFVVKYNTSGVVQWAAQGGGGTDDFGNGIAVDGSGNVYITGRFQSSTAVFETNAPLPPSFAILTNLGLTDVFVVKYNTSGAVQWGVKGGGNINEVGNGIAVDGSGNVYITGQFDSATATFSSTNSNSVTLTNTNSTISSINDVFVAKYNTSGVIQWAVKGGSAGGQDNGASIAVDGSGNAYITGSFGGNYEFAPATFGSTTLINTSLGDDVFVAKYNTSGVVQWAVKGGGTANDSGDGIATNASGTRVYTALRYVPNAKFGSTIVKAGSYLLWMYGE